MASVTLYDAHQLTVEQQPENSNQPMVDAIEKKSEVNQRKVVEQFLSEVGYPEIAKPGRKNGEAC